MTLPDRRTQSYGRRQYLRWATACWQGRAEEVIEELCQWQTRAGPLPDGQEVPETDPRKILRSTVTYLTNNGCRMDYPRYRRKGLPVTSSLAESLVKQVSKRVKGTEKFWNDGPSGAENTLITNTAWPRRLNMYAKDRFPQQELNSFCCGKPKSWVPRPRKRGHGTREEKSDRHLLLLNSLPLCCSYKFQSALDKSFDVPAGQPEPVT